MWQSDDRKVVANDNPSGYGVTVTRIPDGTRVARPTNIVRASSLTAERGWDGRGGSVRGRGGKSLEG